MWPAHTQNCCFVDRAAAGTDRVLTGLPPVGGRTESAIHGPLLCQLLMMTRHSGKSCNTRPVSLQTMQSQLVVQKLQGDRGCLCTTRAQNEKSWNGGHMPSRAKIHHVAVLIRKFCQVSFAEGFIEVVFLPRCFLPLFFTCFRSGLQLTATQGVRVASSWPTPRARDTRLTHTLGLNSS